LGEPKEQINFDQWYQRLAKVPTPTTLSTIIGDSRLDPETLQGQDAWRKLYHETQKVTGITWTELENATNIIVNHMKNSRLTDPKAWIDGSALSHESFDRTPQLDESLYVAGIILDKDARLFILGEPEGDALTFIKSLKKLQLLGIMNPQNGF
jgi:hypothetical protein